MTAGAARKRGTPLPIIVALLLLLLDGTCGCCGRTLCEIPPFLAILGGRLFADAAAGLESETMVGLNECCPMLLWSVVAVSVVLRRLLAGRACSSPDDEESEVARLPSPSAGESSEGLLRLP